MCVSPVLSLLHWQCRCPVTQQVELQELQSASVVTMDAFVIQCHCTQSTAQRRGRPRSTGFQTQRAGTRAPCHTFSGVMFALTHSIRDLEETLISWPNTAVPSYDGPAVPWRETPQLDLKCPHIEHSKKERRKDKEKEIREIKEKKKVHPSRLISSIWSGRWGFSTLHTWTAAKHSRGDWRPGMFRRGPSHTVDLPASQADHCLHLASLREGFFRDWINTGELALWQQSEIFLYCINITSLSL